MKAVIANEIGLKLDDAYPWKDTFFGLSEISELNSDKYTSCKKFLEIKYSENIDFSGAREVTAGCYLSDDYFFDKKHGVKIIFVDENTVKIITSQECNEWFQILVQVQLSTLGISMLHAAAMYKNDQAIVFPSWGGVGKTATVAVLSKEGWKLLGDDIVLVDAEGGIRPYLKDFVIYPYHSSLFPEFFKTSNRPKLPLFLNNLASKFWPSIREVIRPFPKLLAYARRVNPQSKRVRPSALFDRSSISDLSTRVRASHFIWLERTTCSSGSELANLSKSKLASKMAAVTLHEVMDLRVKIVLAMISGGNASYETTFVNPYKIFLSALETSQSHMVKIPESVDISKVPHEINKIVKTKLLVD